MLSTYRSLLPAFLSVMMFTVTADAGAQAIREEKLPEITVLEPTREQRTALIYAPHNATFHGSMLDGLREAMNENSGQAIRIDKMVWERKSKGPFTSDSTTDVGHTGRVRYDPTTLSPSRQFHPVAVCHSSWDAIRWDGCMAESYIQLRPQG